MFDKGRHTNDIYFTIYPHHNYKLIPKVQQIQLHLNHLRPKTISQSDSYSGSTTKSLSAGSYLTLIPHNPYANDLQFADRNRISYGKRLSTPDFRAGFSEWYDCTFGTVWSRVPKCECWSRIVFVILFECIVLLNCNSLLQASIFTDCNLSKSWTVY